MTPLKHMKKICFMTKFVLSSSLSAIVLFSSSSAFADNVCNYKWNDFPQRLEKSHNRLSFVNPAGPLNIGVCWWHSRMQRNANYLLSFSPSSPKMSEQQAHSLIKNLSRTNTVQTAQGYKNLKEFSTSYSREMQEALGQWQLTDTFFKLGWVRGIGPSRVSAENLSSKMNQLYEDVVLRKNITYQVLQMPGFKAHAWLVTGVQKNNDSSYTVTAVDSNSLNIQKYTYKKGLTQFAYNVDGRTYAGEEFVPYTQYENKWKDYTKALKNSCAP